MSRLGKLPISVPSGVTVELTPGMVTTKGPKGTVVETYPRDVNVRLEGSTVLVDVGGSTSSRMRAMWGLVHQLVANAVQGASQGYERKLEISGIGFKAQVEGKNLVLALGFSHPVNFLLPADVKISVEKNTIIVSGASKQIVGQVAAKIRALKPPEPYKGKGIRYSDETVRRKAGKVVKAAGAK